MLGAVIVGERLVGGNPNVRQAILSRNSAFIRKIAANQASAGAQALDLHAAAAGLRDEAENLAFLIREAQAAVQIPFFLGASHPSLLRYVLPFCNKPPVLNSYSCMTPQRSAYLDLATCFSAVVVQCLDEKGIHTKAKERIAIAKRLAKEWADAGVAENQLIFDPVTLPQTVGAEAEVITLETMTELKKHFPAGRVLCAVSNFSYGLAKRRAADAAFAAKARDCGADIFICDPRRRGIPG